MVKRDIGASVVDAAAFIAKVGMRPADERPILAGWREANSAGGATACAGWRPTPSGCRSTFAASVAPPPRRSPRAGRRWDARGRSGAWSCTACSAPSAKPPPSSTASPATSASRSNAAYAAGHITGNPSTQRGIWRRGSSRAASAQPSARLNPQAADPAGRCVVVGGHRGASANFSLALAASGGAGHLAAHFLAKAGVTAYRGHRAGKSLPPPALRFPPPACA